MLADAAHKNWKITQGRLQLQRSEGLVKQIISQRKSQIGHPSQPRNSQLNFHQKNDMRRHSQYSYRRKSAQSRPETTYSLASAPRQYAIRSQSTLLKQPEATSQVTLRLQSSDIQNSGSAAIKKEVQDLLPQAQQKSNAFSIYMTHLDPKRRKKNANFSNFDVPKNSLSERSLQFGRKNEESGSYSIAAANFVGNGTTKETNATEQVYKTTSLMSCSQ